MFGLKKKESDYRWPNCSPPREDGLGCGAVNCNGTQYKKSEVTPGQWQWVVDEEIMAYREERAAHKRSLWHALRTRVLTKEEMQEVASYGNYLNIEDNTPYYADDKSRELTNALLAQQIMQNQVNH